MNSTDGTITNPLTADPPLAKRPHLLLAVRDAARALAISERTLWSITAPRGSLPCIKIGRSVRYAIEDLQSWIRANRG
jgi:hypothetical protein